MGMIERFYAGKNAWINAAVVTVLYTFLSYATSGIPIAEGSFRPAIALLSAFAAVYGPLFGFLVGFLGNMGVDLLHQEFWWNWSLGNGIIGFICGMMLMVPDYSTTQTKLTKLHWVMFLILTAAGNYVGLTFAAVLDVLLDRVPFPLAVFQWAITPASVNFLSSMVLGPPLLYLLLRWKRVDELRETD
ncbi:MAG: ECF transporter S component [Clostridia bacterium]